MEYFRYMSHDEGKKEMKIAIQLFGHLRTYKQCYRDLYKNLLNHYDCDIFIHTWDTLDHNTQVWHNYKVKETGQSQEELKKDLKSIYHPKKILIETQHVKDEGEIIAQGNRISVFGMHSMLHSMVQSNHLREEYQKETGVKYDWVLMIRPDILLQDFFLIENFTSGEKENDFYTAGFYKFNNTLNDFRFIGASDVLFFAKPEVIKTIFSKWQMVFDQIKQPETSKYGPEYSFIYAIQQMGFNPILLNYLCKKHFDIKRGTETRNSENMSSVKKAKRKLKFLNSLFRIHLKRQKFEIWLLSKLPVHIFEFQCRLGKSYLLDISIGKREKGI